MELARAHLALHQQLAQFPGRRPRHRDRADSLASHFFAFVGRGASVWMNMASRDPQQPRQATLDPSLRTAGSFGQPVSVIGKIFIFGAVNPVPFTLDANHPQPMLPPH